MKRVLSVIMVIFVCAFWACNNDDNGGEDNQASIEILLPTDGSVFSSSDTIYFSGLVVDPAQPEIDPHEIIWTSSIDAVIGFGIEFSRHLSAGEHLVVMSYTDAEDGVISDTVSISVTSIGSPPELTITSPSDGARFAHDEEIVFTGTGTDVEDGTLPSTSLFWSSNIDGEIGNGSRIEITLSTGNHIITLSAEDSDGNYGSTSIDITVFFASEYELSVLSELEMTVAIDVAIKGSFAYIAGGVDGIHVIDISDPASPSIVGGAAGGPGQDNAIFLQGDFVYTADGSGLQIFDISNPTNPVERGSLILTGIARHVFVRGEYAYMAMHEHGLAIVDISNPDSPTALGQYIPDATDVANRVFVDGDLAYIAYNSTGIHIIDISDPTEPFRISSYNTWGEAKAVTVVEGIAFVADGRQGLRVIDVNDPLSPFEHARFIDVNQVHDVAIVGNYAFLADVWQGLHVIDISYFADLRRVAKWSSSRGAWVVTVHGDHAYLPCNNNGFKIVDISVLDVSPSLGFTICNRFQIQDDSLFRSF